MTNIYSAILALFTVLMTSAPALANSAAANMPLQKVSCEDDVNFERWIADFRAEALRSGISASTLNAARQYMTFDQTVINRDNAQAVFQQPFLVFSERMASQARIKKALQLYQTHLDLFNKIEQEYGVPAAPILAFWGLETDFGVNTGKFSIIRSVTTLAYNCRRAAYFRTQLMDALRIVQRGDQSVDMIGNWAGEMGGLQFTPSDYFKSAVDYDGDGRRDLARSIPDTLATAANFLKSLGWQRGQPWLQQVQVPANLPWEKADKEIKLPRSEWVRMRVTGVNGQIIANDNLPASLILPMGRLGPAFLAYPSFNAFLGWNAAIVYSTTAAYLATRITGSPAIRKELYDVPVLTPEEMMELQQLLKTAGYNVGEPDGKLGMLTRAATRAAQLRLRLPADSYPSPELLERLRSSN